MPEIAVQVQNVSKKFSRSLKRAMYYASRDILSDIAGIRQPAGVLRKGEFWSVDNVSFEVPKGECLGLIGANGAGKSTLLKMLNGIIRPDAGRIAIHGKVGALIEVGAGFHPMLSGMENIYVNGAILGMSKSEIDNKLESIIEFSGLDEDMLEAPVKTYSSGMYVRLGFSVAVHSEPDVLLVDEVLAVGDVAFVAKCHKRILDLMEGGMTCILVSHSLATIDAFCKKAVLMDRGKVMEYGPAQAATTKLRELLLFAQPEKKGRSPKGHSRQLTITNVRAIDTAEHGVIRIPCGETRNFEFSLQALETQKSGTVSVWIQRMVDGLKAQVGYLRIGEDIPELSTGIYEFAFPMYPSPGEYRVGVTISGEDIMDLICERASAPLEIAPSDLAHMPRTGNRLTGICVAPVEFVRSHATESLEQNSTPPSLIGG